MKRIISIIIMLSSPFIGALIGGLFSERVHPNSVLPENWNDEDMNRHTDQILAVFDARRPFYLFGGFGGAALGAVGAFVMFRSGERQRA